MQMLVARKQAGKNGKWHKPIMESAGQLFPSRVKGISAESSEGQTATLF